MPTRKPYVHACGTPREHCSGAITTVNAGMRGSTAIKAHMESQQAFACHKNWLVSVLGYLSTDDARTLKPGPNTPPERGDECVVLTKQSRFGARLRNGKEGTRNMPHVRGHRAGARGGIIISK